LGHQERLTVAVDRVKLAEFLGLMEGVARYVIDPGLMEMLGGEDVTRSLRALHRSGVAKLPYPVVMVEYDRKADVRNYGESKEVMVRHVVCLTERPPDSKHPEEEVFHPFRGVLLRHMKVDDRELVLLSPTTSLLAFDEEAGPERAFGVHWALRPAPWMKPHPRVDDLIAGTSEQDVRAAGDAMFAATLLLHTKGLDRVVVEPTRLNRARLKAGKPTIPRHSILRIGHVYDRQGGSHAYSPTGRHMPVHWRAGHTRRQHHGPRNSLEKLVYIEPCMVNYDPHAGEEPRLPERGVRW
jgi:hypothetical protein